MQVHLEYRSWRRQEINSKKELNVSSQNYRSFLEKEINISKKKSECKLAELQNLKKTKKKV
jgi:hypothetical protein